MATVLPCHACSDCCNTAHGSPQLGKVLKADYFSLDAPNAAYLKISWKKLEDVVWQHLTVHSDMVSECTGLITGFGYQKRVCIIGCEKSLSIFVTNNSGNNSQSIVNINVNSNMKSGRWLCRVPHGDQLECYARSGGQQADEVLRMSLPTVKKRAKAVPQGHNQSILTFYILENRISAGILLLGPCWSRAGLASCHAAGVVQGRAQSAVAPSLDTGSSAQLVPAKFMSEDNVVETPKLQLELNIHLSCRFPARLLALCRTLLLEEMKDSLGWNHFKLPFSQFACETA
ncbi:hypothetical protein CEXT_491971 [Caerostris extrusa]|uniref:Uncharacterized protein n=1 Tax=Caerostris extrusa TaxID=172846 RepID=A0AAV4N5X3_CAEEX|nr:hypothetical protein CEXT_491971 [Caerostris extrusa]